MQKIPIELLLRSFSFIFVIRTTVQSHIKLSDSAQVTKLWTASIEELMSLFSSCKTQILFPSLSESDDALHLADFYTEHYATILLHSFFDNDGSENKILFPQHYQPSSYRLGQAERWSFTQCSTQIYTESLLSKSADTGHRIFGNLGQFLKNMSENPDFVVLMINDLLFHNHFLYNLAIPSLLTVSVKSTFLVLRNREFIDILCIPCNQEWGSYLSWSSELQKYKTLEEFPSSLKLLQSVSFKANSNFHKGVVLWSGADESSECDPLTGGLWTPPRYCTKLILEKTLNFTGAGSELYRTLQKHLKNVAVLGKVANNQYGDPDLIRRVLRHNNDFISSVEWSAIGDCSKNFISVSVLSIHTLNVSAFWRSFDLLTWLLTFIASCLTAVTLATQIFNALGRWRLIYALLLTLGFLFDRSIMPKSMSSKLSMAGAVIIFFWSQVAMMISSGYRGALFSLLTSTMPPAISTRMEEIASDPNLVITNAPYFDIDDTAHSLLHASVDELLDMTNTPSLRVLRHQVRQKMKNFGEKLDFVNSTLPELLYSQTRKGASKVLHQQGPKPPIRLPKNYIFIAEEAEVQSFCLLMTGLKKNVLLTKGPDLPLLMQQIPWFVTRNFFLKYFTEILYQLTESGISERWNQYYTVHKYIEDRSELLELLKIPRTNNGTGRWIGIPYPNVMAGLFVHSDAIFRLEAQQNWVPLPLSVLQVIFQITNALVFISVVVFLYERCRMRLNTISCLPFSHHLGRNLRQPEQSV